MRTPFRPALLPFILAALLLAPAAHAEKADQTKPLVLEADNASYDDLKQVYKLTGNVVLTKGTMVLKANTAEVRTDPEGYQYAIALAKPGELAYLRQKRDNVDEYVDGWAEQIEYDGKQDISKLSRRARMARLQGSTIADEIRGAVITYDARTAFYTAAGGAANAATGNPSGRVRAVLAPRGGAASAAGGPGRSPLDLQPAAPPANR
jgi:lipopolysaccharide export system protein LptA